MKKRFELNIVSSILCQVVAFVCGFYTTKMELQTYGSEVNGLVVSIGQFLSFFSILDLGIGATMIASLYKPLYEKNDSEINKILHSGQKFVNRVSAILIVYVFLLALFYPRFVKSFDIPYTASLILILGFAQFAQYYFGRINDILINASQYIYVCYFIRLTSCLLKTAVSILMIQLGTGIHLYRFSGAFCLLLHPFLLWIYVNRHYRVNRKIKYAQEPIKQKWNGILQHLAIIVFNNTDVFILTLFSSFKIVSVYSVYNVILSNVNNLLTVATQGIQSTLGNLYASGDSKKFKATFAVAERGIQLIALLVFGCCGALIESFIRVYTSGIDDINYSVALFGYLLSMAYLLQCYRIPYTMLMYVVCCFKETQMSSLWEMAINISVSLVAFFRFGIIGVAIGTICAVLYRTIYLGIYLSSQILHMKTIFFLKHLVVDLFSLLLIQVFTHYVALQNLSYWAWIAMAAKVFVVCLIIIFAVNILFCRKEMKIIIKLDHDI